jgi:hypothetical protein
MPFVRRQELCIITHSPLHTRPLGPSRHVAPDGVGARPLALAAGVRRKLAIKIRQHRPTLLSTNFQPGRLRQDRSVGCGLAAPMPFAARNESVSAWNIMLLVKACVATS